MFINICFGYNYVFMCAPVCGYVPFPARCIWCAEVGSAGGCEFQNIVDEN